MKELSKIPEVFQSKVEKIVFDDLRYSNPYSSGYIEQMTGYTDKYKIRIGSYRIGLTIKKAERLIICERIAHRKEIYRLFP